MDSTQMPQFQAGTTGTTGTQMPPVAGQGPTTGPLPMVQQVEVKPVQKKDIAGLVKTIVIVVLSLALVTFIGLFIWMYIQFSDARADVEGEISIAVAEAKDEQSSKMEAEFLEREKYPYKTFSGPVDYGQLSFEYPKTWSFYIESDASKGGDYRAYMNPGEVDPIANTTVNALRITILDKAFDSVVDSYQKELNKKEATLSMESVTINGVTANRYTGVIPGTQFQGYIVVFKIRDKTAILQTDSVLFADDFNKLIETIKFNA